MAKYDLGIVTCHPLVFAWKQVKSISRTWLYCRKHGLPCNQWYGVYQQGEEIVLAQCGCMPGAKERAALLIHALDITAP